jgi:hypothetical protein
VAVKVLAGSVVTYRGPRIGVAASDLDVSQIHASIEHYRTTQADVAALKSAYRFLDPRLTDFMLDGFNEGTASELIG